jgi:hypothetical protein
MWSSPRASHPQHRLALRLALERLPCGYMSVLCSKFVYAPIVKV